MEVEVEVRVKLARVESKTSMYTRANSKKCRCRHFTSSYQPPYGAPFVSKRISRSENDFEATNRFRGDDLVFSATIRFSWRRFFQFYADDSFSRRRFLRND